MRAKHWSIGRGAEVGEHSPVRIPRSCRVRTERDIEDRRVVWQAGRTAQDLRKGQLVEPDECQAIVKSPELLLELPRQNLPICPDPITMKTCLVWGSSCRMTSMRRG